MGEVPWAGGARKDRSAIRVARPWGFFAAKTPLRMTWYAIIGSKRLGMDSVTRRALEEGIEGFGERGLSRKDPAEGAFHGGRHEEGRGARSE
jgi:hypothetical protein